MRRTVQLWDRVRVAGEDWQAVAVAGDMVALKSADGARLETLTQAELLTTAKITTPGRPSAQLRIVEELSAEDRERLQFLQSHILDLIACASRIGLTGTIRAGTPSGSRTVSASRTRT